MVGPDRGRAVTEGMLNVKSLVLAGAVVLALTGAATAESLRMAQGRALPPYEILTIVRSTGLSPIGQPARQGGQYVLRALDRRGQPRRVLVDAMTGDVLESVPVVSANRYYQGAGREPAPREAYDERGPRGNVRESYAEPRALAPGPGRRIAPADRDDWEPGPTGSVPRDPPRVIGAPNTKPAPKIAAATPARTPLPRPRPIVTLVGNDAPSPQAPAAQPETAKAETPPAAGKGPVFPPVQIPE